MNSDDDDDEYETKCGKYFTYCLEEKLTDIFTSDAPMIVCSHHLSCYCYSDSPIKNRKIFVYINADKNGIITYERLFREYDRLVGCELERLNKTYNSNCQCNHIFIEGIIEITKIHYEFWCGS